MGQGLENSKPRVNLQMHQFNSNQALPQGMQIPRFETLVQKKTKKRRATSAVLLVVPAHLEEH